MLNREEKRMTKSKKILIWIIVVLIASILLGLAVRVGMYYYEYRQDSKHLEFFKENIMAQLSRQKSEIFIMN